MTDRTARRGAALPASLAPRGLSRDQAAGYIGVSAAKFDQMVTDGRMPKPKMIDARVLWDRWALDVAFETLPDREKSNPWDAGMPA
jgi:hypothetical protein